MTIKVAEAGRVRGSRYYLLLIFEWLREVQHRLRQQQHQSLVSADLLHGSNDGCVSVLTDRHALMEYAVEAETLMA